MWYEFKSWYQFYKETRLNPIENPYVSERYTFLRKNPFLSDEEIDMEIKKATEEREILVVSFSEEN